MEKYSYLMEQIYNTACVKNGFGNRILYDMCSRKDPEAQNTEALGDKIWLIGRSYAASPERRYTWKKDEKNNAEQKKLTTTGDGTETYFHYIAGQLQFPIDDFKNQEYRFDFSDDDLQKLKSSIEAVLEFSNSVRDANKKYDEDYNKAQADHMIHRNQLSFSSKFLHFHYPDSIFIFDDFSAHGGRYLFPKQKRKDTKVYIAASDISFTQDTPEAIINSALPDREPSQKILKDFHKRLREAVDLKEVDPELVKCYVDHCFNAYAAGCLIRICANGRPISCTMPRAADNLLLHTRIKIGGKD